MIAPRSATLLFIAAALACVAQPANPSAVENQATGLVGTVLRGPIQPVCRVGQTCEAPFSAGFEVLQQQHLVAQFRSDSVGHYQVLLSPGAYTIVADSGAPIWPRGQSHLVTVGSTGLTHLDLSFDTGIR